MPNFRAEVMYSDPFSTSLVIGIGHKSQQQGFIEAVDQLGSRELGTVFKTYQEGELVEPIKIDEDVAKALYEALSRYYGSTQDTKQLRKDYDAERARVDKLIGAIINGSSKDNQGSY